MAAALIAVVVAVPVALLTYAAVSRSSSGGSGSPIAAPPVLAPPSAASQDTRAGLSVPVARAGIPFGPPKLPMELYGEIFTGTKLTVTPETIAANLADARSRSMHVFVITTGAQHHYKTADGSFDIDRWKSLLDEYRGIDLDEFVEDGTIIAHQLISEAKAPSQWNGTIIPNHVLDEMARYSKEIWPTVPTVVRTDPSDLEEHAAAFGTPWPGWRWRHLDAASARYLTRKGGVEEFATNEQSSAGRQRLALVTGVNVLSGGDGSSGIPSPRAGRWAMSPDELLEYGTAMLLGTRACAFEMWRYETPGSTFQDYRYFRRPEINAAMVRLATIASRLPARPCRWR